MKSNKLSWVIFTAVIALALSVCLDPSVTFAKQVPVIAAKGDPGDGSESQVSGGGIGDPTDGEGGDPTAGNGRAARSTELAFGSSQDGVAGDPGDGEEGGLFAGVRSEWIDSIYNLVQALYWAGTKR